MRLRELRTEKNMYQKDVATLLGVDRTTYAKYESEASEPNRDILLKLAQIFDVSTDYLLGRTDQKKGPTPVAGDGLLYPPEYDLLSQKDKDIVNDLIRSLAKKQSDA